MTNKPLKLITERCEEIKVLSESSDGSPGKSFYIEGPFMQSEVKNRNNRVYPRSILEREFNRFNEDYVIRGRALGELGHPEDPGLNYDNVSHKIVEMKQEGSTFYGKAKILESFPKGKLAAALIKEQIPFGVSTRGLGSVEEVNGVDTVCEDFYLATIDIVHDPSAPDAWVNGIMESRNWIMESGVFKPIEVSTTKAKLEKAYRKPKSTSREAEIVNLLENFLHKLTKS